jgi:hypothetical protein
MTMYGSEYVSRPKPVPPLKACVEPRGDSVLDIMVDARGLVVRIGVLILTQSPATRDSLYGEEALRLSRMFGSDTQCPQSDNLSETDVRFYATPFGHARLAKFGTTKLHVGHELGPGYCHGGV